MSHADGDAARLAAHVAGRVQGVGFRDWVRRQAQQLGLAGSATNLPDGRVEVIAQGPREACESLLNALRGERTPGYVDEVDAGWSDPAADTDGFVTR